MMGGGKNGRPGAGGGLGNIFSIGKSNAKLINKTDRVAVTFKDVRNFFEKKGILFFFFFDTQFFDEFFAAFFATF